METRRCTVLIAMMKALLGEVPANLRAVTVRYDEATVHFDCYFDGKPSEEDIESMLLVDTELVADLPATDTITHSVIQCDYPTRMPQDHDLIYRRREPDPDDDV